MNGILINPHIKSITAVLIDPADVLSSLYWIMDCTNVAVIIPNEDMTIYADEEGLLKQQPGFTFTTRVPGTDKDRIQMISAVGVAIILGPPDGDGNDTAALCTPETVRTLVQWNP